MGGSISADVSYVCRICICMPYMCALYVCLICAGNGSAVVSVRMPSLPFAVPPGQEEEEESDTAHVRLSLSLSLSLSPCVCVFVCVCVRACVRASECTKVICLPYMYALYVCRIYVPYTYA